MNRWRPTVLTFLLMASTCAAQVPLRWPTADTRFMESRAEPDAWAQPTASGRLESALFGAVRNGGYRFHEGIDIGPALTRDRRGEARDPILAVLPGRVALINSVAGNSSYGRYVVLTHEDADVAVYTLYAHLAHIDDDLSEGQWVAAGTTLGIMGRSAGGYSIPKSRAHLHFEIGLMKTRHFQHWYDRQGYGSPNRFGNFNGINLLGMNPLPVLEAARDGQLDHFADYLKNLPTAFTLRVSTSEIPDFITRYPRLLTQPIPRQSQQLVGWLVEYTWYGLPKRWTPLTPDLTPAAREGDIALVNASPEAFPPKIQRTLTFDPNGHPTLHKTLRNDLELIFGF